MLNINKGAAYRRLFLDDHGQLKPEAKHVLDDLANFTRLWKNSPADSMALAVIEGSRQVLRHILKRLKINDTERQMKGIVYDE